YGDDLALREAICGRDAARVALDERRPAEYVVASNDVARRRVALSQPEREAHHAVGENVEIVDRIADRVDARVLREGLQASKRGDALALRLGEAREETRLREDARRTPFVGPRGTGQGLSLLRRLRAHH